MAVPTDTPQEAQERLDLMKLMDEGPYKVPNRRVDENLILGTWNIQQFSEKKTWRALKYMANIIERFDIIAIQELKSNLVGLRRLQEILPGRYRILVSDVTVNAERFAFIYDQRTVEPTGLVAEIGLPISTVKHEGFQIHRMPYCASFSAGRFDFTVVSVHIFETSTFVRRRSTCSRRILQRCQSVSAPKSWIATSLLSGTSTSSKMAIASSMRSRTRGSRCRTS